MLVKTRVTAAEVTDGQQKILNETLREGEIYVDEKETMECL